MPCVSEPPNVVPVWNADAGAEVLAGACTFAAEHLHDDGCVIVFHPYSLTSKQDLAGACKTFDLKKMKDWLGMNRMHLTSPTEKAETVMLILV